ncbi:MAG: UDP-N-acetylmuramoyl-L-alanine--D-glutamate ligase [Candidatus Moranbacteria bacterium]|nr:UDP-N-acetylmuramoyl-L-alanine--D-glutamate ligase [Candidatus Moranbacteria bacterium]
MEMSDFRKKKITVMGLGLHGGGIGVIRFLFEAGATLSVTDLKSEQELEASLVKLKDLPGIKYVLGQHQEDDFTKADMVVKNPAVPWTNKYIQLALKNDVPVEIDSSLFFKLCKNKIIGVTGTRGKTTTASLIFEILRAAGMSPVKVGIGQVSVLDKLKELEKDSVVVFELSSWRLSALGRAGLSPEIAVLTNIFQDHLNYYPDMAEYLADKKYIFSQQKKSDFCVLNWDDEKLRELEKEINSQLVRFSQNKIAEEKSVYVSNNAIYAKWENVEERVMDVSEVTLKGAHNLANILASIAVGKALNIEAEIIKKGILSFSGLPHRLEFVRELDGVRYYNDTAATSPDGAISSLNSFVEPIVLIAGGSDKNLDMRDLAEAIRNATDRVVFLPGVGTDKIIKEWQDSDKKYAVANSMDSAVSLAKNLAKKGDVVLLSPGTASFGLFVNEFDRGDKFKLAVNSLV